MSSKVIQFSLTFVVPQWRLDIRHAHTVTYLCKMAPVAKFEYAPFFTISILEIGAIFAKRQS